MSEFEDKLQSILGNQEAMSQIMSIAQSITGNSPPGPSPEEYASAEDRTPEQGGLLPALGDLDPRLLQMGMRLLSEYRSTDEKKVALLTALQPFVKNRHADQVEQAIRIAKLSHIIRLALDSFKKGGEEFV